MTLEMVDPLSTLSAERCADIKHGIVINGIKSSHLLVCQNARDFAGWLGALRNTALHFHEGDGEGAPAADGAGGQPDGGTDWLHDAPEEMDVCIAQRNFEGAVDFAVRARQRLEESKALAGMVGLRRSLDEKVDKLTEALCAELQRPAIRKSAVRAAVRYLLRLGKGDLAHEVYLANRSARIKHKFRKVKMEGSTELYALKLSRTFFSTMQSTCFEFAEFFDDGSKSAFVSWASHELRQFATNFTTQVLQSLNKIITIAQCVQKVMHQCDKLHDCGLDLSFVLWEMLEPKTVEAVNDAGQALLAATSTDLDIDDWAAQDFNGNKYALKQLLENLTANDFDIVDEYVQGKKCVLFEVTTNLAVRVHEYIQATVCLINLRMDDVLLPWLVEVFGTVAKWLARKANGKSIFVKNFDAVLWLLWRSRDRIEEVTERECETLAALEVDIKSAWEHGAEGDTLI